MRYGSEPSRYASLDRAESGDIRVVEKLTIEVDERVYSLSGRGSRLFEFV